MGAGQRGSQAGTANSPKHQSQRGLRRLTHPVLPLSSLGLSLWVKPAESPTEGKMGYTGVSPRLTHPGEPPIDRLSHRRAAALGEAPPSVFCTESPPAPRRGASRPFLEVYTEDNRRVGGQNCANESPTHSGGGRVEDRG